MTKRSDLPEEATEEFRTLSPSELGDRAWKSLDRIAEAERRDEPPPDNLSATDPLRSVGTLSSPAEDEDDGPDKG
jgi:hypothetical protein